MKVALLSRAVFPLHGYGGLERHVAGLKKHLELAGLDVVLYTAPPTRECASTNTRFVPYRLLPWPRAKGFTILDRDTNYLLWSLRAGRRLLAEERPDIVQADGGAGFGYACLSGGEDAPLVLHPHGMEEFEAPALKRAAYLPLRKAIQFSAKRAACVLAPDASMKGNVARHLEVGADRITVLPNAIDLDEIDRRVEEVDLQRLGIETRHRVLLSVGRLEDNKGFSSLVRALANVRDELPENWLWVLVGAGPRRSGLEELVRSEGLAGRARLAGTVTEDELWHLYERAELFVHPTLFEGSSMVTLEAMSHRKPVVATRVGGIPDKVVDGETGLLVPPSDEESLGRAVVAAMGEPELLSEWGRAGREIIEAMFSWKARAAEVVRLYEELTSGRPPKGSGGNVR